jgi:hypothetical protein
MLMESFTRGSGTSFTFCVWYKFEILIDFLLSNGSIAAHCFRSSLPTVQTKVSQIEGVLRLKQFVAYCMCRYLVPLDKANKEREAMFHVHAVLPRFGGWSFQVFSW